MLAGARAQAAPAPARELEEIFLAICEAHYLTQPEVNVRVEGHEVDFLWRGTEGSWWRSTAPRRTTRGRAFERDRARDAELTRRDIA